MSTQQSGPGPTAESADLALGALAVVAAMGGALYVGAWTSARLSGHKLPKASILAVVTAFRDWRDPSLAWHGPVGPAWMYWGVTIVILLALAVLAWGL